MHNIFFDCCQHWRSATICCHLLISFFQAGLLWVRLIASTRFSPVHSLMLLNHCFFWRPLLLFLSTFPSIICSANVLLLPCGKSRDAFFLPALQAVVSSYQVPQGCFYLVLFSFYVIFSNHLQNHFSAPITQFSLAFVSVQLLKAIFRDFWSAQAPDTHR